MGFDRTALNLFVGFDRYTGYPIEVTFSQVCSKLAAQSSHVSFQ